jgi:hypothetical protein
MLEPTARLSSRVVQMIEGVSALPATRSVGKAFRSHEPAIDLFPVNLWARVAARVLRRAPRALEEWRRLHPDTLVLKPLPGYADRIGTANRLIFGRANHVGAAAGSRRGAGR